MRICPNCESRISDTVKKCRFCGAWVIDNKNSENLKKYKDRNDTLIGLIVGIIICCITIFISFRYNTSSCDNLYKDFTTKNSIIGISEHTVKRGRDNICYALIDFEGNFKGKNKDSLSRNFVRHILDFKNIKRFGTPSWGTYHGKIVIDLNNNKIYKGYIRFFPNDEDKVDPQVILDILNDKTDYNISTEVNNYFYDVLI